MTTDYARPEHVAMAPKWSKVRDAVAGEEAVKAATIRYLPNPDELDKDSQRYDAYLKRAVYYNATGRTLQGLVGVAFANWPMIKTRLAVLLSDADGSGVGLINQSQWILSEVMQTGRGGLLADYAAIDPAFFMRERTVAEAERAGLRPYVSAYSAESILTWETQGGKLTRLVLLEDHATYEGGEVHFLPQLRELVLEDSIYSARIWRRMSDKGQFLQVSSFTTRLDYIPFAFIGSTNNDATPDQPPLLDLASLNLAHYRNSADFEESAFLMGQPQVVISGVTEDWAKDQGVITFGSRRALVLPHDGKADMLQAQPNNLAKEAMLDKERMMQGIGARLVAQREAVVTATQSASETKASYSVLSLACDNVSDAYTKVLQWLETWGRSGTSDASFAIDTRFNDLTLDANAIRETVAAWQAGLVPQSDAWSILRKLGVIDQGKTDLQLAGEIEAAGPPLSLDEAA